VTLKPLRSAEILLVQLSARRVPEGSRCRSSQDFVIQGFRLYKSATAANIARHTYALRRANLALHLGHADWRASRYATSGPTVSPSCEDVPDFFTTVSTVSKNDGTSPSHSPLSKSPSRTSPLNSTSPFSGSPGGCSPVTPPSPTVTESMDEIELDSWIASCQRPRHRGHPDISAAEHMVRIAPAMTPHTMS